jgi:polynucleotide 5'-kinase involved in rRNA processing
MKIRELPVYHPSWARRFSLLGLLDDQGFCLGLGIVLKWGESEAEILTPISEKQRITAMQVAALRIDPQTGLEIT